MRCARCHTPACYTARKHTVTFGVCLRHHAHVGESLIRDGWILAPVKVGSRAIA